MLLSLVVELQGDLGIQADAKVVVHHTLLHVALSGWEKKTATQANKRLKSRGHKQKTILIFHLHLINPIHLELSKLATFQTLLATLFLKSD